MTEINGLLNIIGNAGTLHWIRCPGCNPDDCACENQQYEDGALDQLEGESPSSTQHTHD
jgi:hypothetical protein